jgi:hypothetical protein
MSIFGFGIKILKETNKENLILEENSILLFLKVSEYLGI